MMSATVIRPNRSENPDVGPIGLRNRVIDVEQDGAIRRVNVHARDRPGQIRKLEGKDRGRFVGRESQARDAGSLRIDPSLRTQRSQIERRSISLRRLIEIVHLDQGNTGRVADAAHDSRVIARGQASRRWPVRDHRSARVCWRGSPLAGELRQLSFTIIERAVAVMQLKHRIHQPARERSAVEIEGRTA